MLIRYTASTRWAAPHGCISRACPLQAGFLKVGTAAPGKLTEAIQHGVFKNWIAPIGLYGFFSGMYWITSRRNRLAGADGIDVGDGLGGDGLVGDAAAGVHLAHLGKSRSLRERSHENDSGVHAHNLHRHVPAAPVERKLLTPGVWVLLAMVLTGAVFGLYRFIFGLATTNLDQQHPWRLWVALDVGSTISRSWESGKPTHGITIDHASTHR